MQRVTATYLIETPLPVEQAAATLAAEQSSGTFVAVPGETAELKQRYAARVEKITGLETVAAPAIPTGRAPAAAYHRAEIVVSWSVDNFGYNLPTLISTLQGNLYELAQFSGLKLMDFTVPASFVARFRGPQFGVEGCRRLTGVTGRPLLGTIIKPSIGLTPDQTAAMVKELIEAGIDFLKDDELEADERAVFLLAGVEEPQPVAHGDGARAGAQVVFGQFLRREQRDEVGAPLAVQQGQLFAVLGQNDALGAGADLRGEIRVVPVDRAELVDFFRGEVAVEARAVRPLGLAGQVSVGAEQLPPLVGDLALQRAARGARRGAPAWRRPRRRSGANTDNPPPAAAGGAGRRSAP
jgi:hypothetical protein